MQAIELIRWAMQLSDEAVANLVADMRDAALTPSTPGAAGGEGNHPLWCVGHLAYIEGNVRRALFGEPNPLEHWAPLFATGTVPRAEASFYPAFDEVLAAYRDLRRRNLKLLEEIGDGGLDRGPRRRRRGSRNL